MSNVVATLVTPPLDDNPPPPTKQDKWAAHISSLDDNNNAATYCKYLPVIINNVKCAAFLDSGNTWRPAISLQFFDEMGLKMKSDLKSIDTKSIGTAKDNARLRVFGEVKTPMILKTVNPELSLIIRPIVVDGQSMHINISGPWRRSNAWDQIHSTNSIRIDQKHILKLQS